MNKPMPRITDISRPFWDGCNQDRLLIQHCTAPGCGKFVYFPRVACPHCHRDTLEWQEVSGAGTVESHTTVHRPHHESFAPLVPYVFGAIRLNEGPLVYARLRQAEPSTDLIGRPVQAAYEPHTGDQNILVFDLKEA